MFSPHSSLTTEAAELRPFIKKGRGAPPDYPTLPFITHERQQRLERIMLGDYNPYRGQNKKIGLMIAAGFLGLTGALFAAQATADHQQQTNRICAAVAPSNGTESYANQTSIDPLAAYQRQLNHQLEQQLVDCPQPTGDSTPANTTTSQP